MHLLPSPVVTTLGSLGCVLPRFTQVSTDMFTNTVVDTLLLSRSGTIC